MYPEVYTFKELVLKIGSIPKSTSITTKKVFISITEWTSSQRRRYCLAILRKLIAKHFNQF